MPSWSAHRRVYILLRNREAGLWVISDDMSRRIDEIIDDINNMCGEHDVGRKPKPESFVCMLLMLFVEFGDIVIDGRFTRSLREKRYQLALEILEAVKFRMPLLVYSHNYEMYIPDSALVLATMHHMLDVFADCINDYGSSIDSCDIIIECVRKRLWSYREYARRVDLRVMTGESFTSVFDWLLTLFRKYCKDIIEIIEPEFRAKGLIPGCNANAFRDALLAFIREKGVYGIVCVSEGAPYHGRPLPAAFAATKVYNVVRQGKTMHMYFSNIRGNPCYYGTLELSFNDYSELCKFIKQYRIRRL